MHYFKKLISTFSHKNDSNPIEDWVSYLQKKIAANQSTINMLEEQNLDYLSKKADQIDSGIEFGTNYDLSISNNQQTIRSLVVEVNVWQREIEDDDFKGYY